MMRLFANFRIVMFGMALALILTLSVATPSYAANECADGKRYLLTFPAWYNGVVDNDCNIKQPGNGDEDAKNFAFTIGLNIAEIILQLVAYATIVMLIRGGFDYMTSAGDANKMSSAKSTITNALVGLVIALSAVAIVRFIGDAV